MAIAISCAFLRPRPLSDRTSCRSSVSISLAPPHLLGEFLAFVFFYRVFEKLKVSEPEVAPVEYGEDEGRPLRMGECVLRSLTLVFGCMAVSSPEVILAIAASILCYFMFMASYYSCQQMSK